MIPLHLTISGFLSYRDRADLDFSGFDLACIAGPNGAGKSSLLDAITWSLFGQARKRDDSLINTFSDLAEVSLTFAYEGNVYRVMRSKPRNKTTLLEFHILQNQSNDNKPYAHDKVQFQDMEAGIWKPLTERTLRDTEARIQETLRLDYETFVNASFFLQGKADQFTQQRPADRKRILASILGLEIWESYRQQAAERRRGVQGEINALDGRLQEIAAELAEEPSRKARLQELKEDLDTLSHSRAAHEATLENMRKIAATLAEQERLVEILARQTEEAMLKLNTLTDRLRVRQEELNSFSELLSRSDDIEASYEVWKQAWINLQEWEKLATRFRGHEKRRQEPQDEITATRASLLQEQKTLEEQQSKIISSESQIQEIKNDLSIAEEHAREAEQKLAQCKLLAENLQSARQQQGEAQVDNSHLKAEMDKLKGRIDQLMETEGATCPLCGQPMSSEERLTLIDNLNTQGTEMGDHYRANLDLITQTNELIGNLENQIKSLSGSEDELRGYEKTTTQLSSQLEVLTSQRKNWEDNLAPRLAEITSSLAEQTFAPQARSRLAAVDEELRMIGYDPAKHDAERLAVSEGEGAEEDMRALEAARGAITPLEREITDLKTQIAAQEKDVTQRQEEHASAAETLDASRHKAPDLAAAESELLSLQEKENRLRMEVGAAKQKVLVLDDLKTRHGVLETERDELTNQVVQYKLLERAFGKDGVPALLIEQALPQIETKANEILDRLTAGSMSVRFVTQAAYKDKRREDLRETLEIQISDNAGTRDYEMFSGGEAFRVNFSIRLALSEVLAQRAGARLQTLVIDEGFGSQDALGRQRLVEAINLVRQDFAKILVITHIDELKDAFPNRIEVEKTARGSTVNFVF
jgi:exonuclease SbcC